MKSTVYTNLNSPDQIYGLNHLIHHFIKTNFIKLIIGLIVFLLFFQYASSLYVYTINNINLIPNSVRNKNEDFFSMQSLNLSHLQKFMNFKNKTLSRENFVNKDIKLINFIKEKKEISEYSFKNIISDETKLNKTNENLYLNYLLFVNNETNSDSTSLNRCPIIPPNLVGRIKVMQQNLTFSELEALHSELYPGGYYKPLSCKARQKVAFIIPYRNREYHLRIFLHNIHPLLQKQQAEYVIYVVEQVNNYQFNRAKLFNIGYVEALKQYDFDCFIFHDVDLIPEDDRNFYRCSNQPRHMSVAINTMNYKLPYTDIFGGVNALSKQQMDNVNGFSNVYWGWGGEDDDMALRIRSRGYSIIRYQPNIARYTMMTHKKEVPNPNRYKTLYKSKYRIRFDGLNSLKYERIEIVFKKLYTWILVDLLPPKKEKYV